MSLELFNEPTSISRRFSREFLEKALELACLYGWRPLGTHPPSILDFHLLNAEWNGTYLTNDGQIVSAEDARSLAVALEKSLDDIPDEGVTMDWSIKFWVDDDLPEWLSPEERELLEDGLDEHSPGHLKVHPFAFFAGDEKQQLVHFMRFCRLGSFTIL
jgi:hypothetical protein